MPSHDVIPSPYASILYHSRLNSGAPAVVIQGNTVSYADFCTHIERVTRRLHQLRMQPGTKVAVNVGNPYLHWLVVFALSRLGLVSASVSIKELDALAPDVVIAGTPDGLAGRKLIEVSLAWFTEAADLPPFIDRMHAPDEAARIVLSSGTTGTPKQVLLTYGQLHTRGMSIIADYNVGPPTRMLVMMGISSLIGYKMVCNCWAAGGAVILASVAAGKPPSQLLAAQPNFVFASPTQLEKLVNSLPPDFLPRDVRIYVGGSTLARTLNVKTRLKLSPWLYNCYGSTEVGIVSLAPMVHAHSNPNLTGYVMPAVRVEIVDEHHRALPRGTVGQIRIKSEGQVHSYLNDPESTARYFRDGWFYPGDLGALDDRDALSLNGRASEVMNVGGVKLAPTTIEEALAGTPGVAELAVFATGNVNQGERPCVAVVVSGELSDEDLQSRFRKAFPGLRPLTIHRVESIPRNDMGKVLRAELAATFGQRSASDRLH